MSDKKAIEKRLRRSAGMSAEKVEAMHKANATAVWSARCWSCRATVEAPRTELEHMSCPKCGANLWSRA
jgi:predicted RNA-binding Zn-ribbon protein involved in translation (DUF1610 family)